MRLAYLCNVYPAVSHSFVRREIEGLEAAGHEVRRFSMRPAPSDLKDDADFRELGITEAALGSGVPALIWAALMLSLTRPLKTLAAESWAPVFSRWTSLMKSMIGVSSTRARLASHSVVEWPISELT